MTIVLCQCYRINILKGVLTVPMLRATLGFVQTGSKNQIFWNPMFPNYSTHKCGLKSD